MLKDAYTSMQDAISSIESYLPAVENEDLNYDLNRQLQDYRRIQQLCKEELLRYGSMEDLEHRGEETHAQSWKERFTIENSQSGRTDGCIAKELANQVAQRMDQARQYAKQSVSVAANHFANEFIKEETTHLDRLAAYMEDEVK